MMFRKLNPDAIARLNDPNQGMSYKGRDHGQRKYDPDTGKPYYTPSRPATLTIYGERAETVMAIIEHCQEVAAALTPSATMEGVMRAAAISSSEHRYDPSALSGDAGEASLRDVEEAYREGYFAGTKDPNVENVSAMFIHSKAALKFRGAGHG